MYMYSVYGTFIYAKQIIIPAPYLAPCTDGLARDREPAGEVAL